MAGAPPRQAAANSPKCPPIDPVRGSVGSGGLKSLNFSKGNSIVLRRCPRARSRGEYSVPSSPTISEPPGEIGCPWNSSSGGNCLPSYHVIVHGGSPSPRCGNSYRITENFGYVSF